MTVPTEQGLADFGERLRRIRKQRRLSQEQVAGKIGCSDSTLSRYERGDLLIPETRAKALDELFRGEGHLLAERNALAAGTWLPPGAFRTRWEYNHPAEYSGPIWMRVVPDHYYVGQRHRVEVRWRNWKLCREALLDEEGAWFVHTKGNDGQSIPIEVTVNPACRVAFGQGLAPGQPIVDINHGWAFWLVYDVLRKVRTVAGVVVRARRHLPTRVPAKL